MTCLRSLTVWTLVFGVLSVGSAHAAQIEMRTYRLEGNLYDVTDQNGVFDSSIQDGSPFTMTISIPADTPGYLNVYKFPEGVPGAGITFSVAGTPIDMGTPTPYPMTSIINVTPDVGPTLGWFSGHQQFEKAFQDGSIRSTLLDFYLFPVRANVIQSPALPDSLSLADFSASISIVLAFAQGQNPTNPSSYAMGQVTSLEITNEMMSIEVPEPSTGLLFGTAAVGGLGYSRLRRRRR